MAKPADDTSTEINQDIDATTPTRVKRHLKTEPETMRDRNTRLSEKASTDDATTSAGRAFWWGFSWPLRVIGRLFAKLGKYKFFRGVGLVLYPRYFRNSWIELRKVTWPNFRLAWRLTYAVLVFALIFGLVVFVVDLGLDKIFKELFTK